MTTENVKMNQETFQNMHSGNPITYACIGTKPTRIAWERNHEPLSIENHYILTLLKYCNEHPLTQ